MAGEIALIAQLIFSEVDKNPKRFEKDAIAIAHVIKNRLSRPERFGSTLQDVVYAPYQFSGVNSNEWNKISSGKTTAQEQKIYKRILQISNGVWNGTIKDSTSGADHYYNPKLAKPSWSKKMKKTYSSDAHDYYKE
jgi:spore germination cell wall hydrolase CwlJ-like protein